MTPINEVYFNEDIFSMRESGSNINDEIIDNITQRLDI